MKNLLLPLFAVVLLVGCVHRSASPRLVVLPESAQITDGAVSVTGTIKLMTRVRSDYLRGRSLVRIKGADLVREPGVRLGESLENVVDGRLRANLNRRTQGAVWLGESAGDIDLSCDILKFHAVNDKFVLEAEVAVRDNKGGSDVKRNRFAKEWIAGKTVDELLLNYADALDWLADQILPML